MEQHDTICRVEQDGTKWWYKDSECTILHRDGDLPAVVTANGYKAWHKHGERHRDGDLPAIKWANGDKSWWKDGKRHRECGPARIWDDVKMDWWYDGVQVSEDDPRLGVGVLK